MIIAQYFVEFIFYSFLGWVWESIYCTIKERHWQDRGFLFGPICPIYGSCVVAASLLFRFLPVAGTAGAAAQAADGAAQAAGPTSQPLPLWSVFLICVIGSAIAEFSTSWVLEKRFHARWWDYSKMPLNIQGRICLPVSLAFGLAGVVIVKYLLPVMTGAHDVVPGLVYETLALAFAFLMGADYALTEASLSKLLQEIETMRSEFNAKAEDTYEKIAAAPAEIRVAAEVRAEKRQIRREEIADQMQSRREELADQMQSRREELADQMQSRLEERQNAAAEHLAKAQALAARHAETLSAGSRRMLRNMKSFRPAEGHSPVGDKTAGEHLKDALRRLEDRDHTA